jgi:hypothetical protein
MKVLDSSSQIVDLNNEEEINVNLFKKEIWLFDLVEFKFFLQPMYIIEEIITDCMVLDIIGYQVSLPVNWNIFIMDGSTFIYDIVDVSACSRTKFEAFIYGPKSIIYNTQEIKAVNYEPNVSNIIPSLDMRYMLCYPLNNNLWIVVSEKDGFNKYVKDDIRSIEIKREEL